MVYSIVGKPIESGSFHLRCQQPWTTGLAHHEVLALESALSHTIPHRTVAVPDQLFMLAYDPKAGKMSARLLQNGEVPGDG